MASYWRSPYREPNTTSFPTPDHSTLKFEQSLYLSRSRSLINGSSTKCEWLDATFNTPSPNTYRHPVLTRSNTTIKGILKIPKRDGCLLPPKQKENNNNNNSSEESSSGNGEHENKENSVKKRVTFGVNENVDGNARQSEMNQSKSKHFQLKAMKRISHSRLLEETAMKKLNRLIGGSAAAVAENGSLPAVKGTGLLSSPRNSADISKMPKSACSHSEELRCIRCIRKDVENSHNERLHGKASINGSFYSLQPNEKTTSSDNASLNKSGGNGKDWSTQDEMVKDNQENCFNEVSSHDEITRRLGSATTNLPSKYSSKKEFRLLPGRYPFTAGAMHIKKLSIQDIHKAQRGDSTPSTTNVVDLQNEKAPTKQKTGNNNNTNNNNKVVQLPKQINPVDNADSSGMKPTELTIPHVNNSDIKTTTPRTNNEPQYVKVGRLKTNEGGYNDSDDDDNANKTKQLSNDKTSGILQWLNDVHQKRNFKPRASRVYASSDS